MSHTIITLKKSFFSSTPREIVRSGDCRAEIYRTTSGIEAVRLSNRRGHLVILPWYGQMIWQATFDGVDLTMQSAFKEPRPAADIVGTYGCFMYHSGLLRNGNPGPQDSHALHGEMPLAAMDSASIETGEDEHGPWMALAGEREYLMGFGDHYMARPRVVLRPAAATFELRMAVENLSADDMDLMYMCHANFAFVEGGKSCSPPASAAPTWWSAPRFPPSSGPATATWPTCKRCRKIPPSPAPSAPASAWIPSWFSI